MYICLQTYHLVGLGRLQYLQIYLRTCVYIYICTHVYMYTEIQIYDLVGLGRLLGGGGKGRAKLDGELADVHERVLVCDVQVQAEELDDALRHEHLPRGGGGAGKLGVADIGQVEALEATLDEGIRHFQRQAPHHLCVCVCVCVCVL